MKIKRGQTAVITGAAGGIGTAFAEQLTARGCNLALADINSEGLKILSDSLSPAGTKVTTHVVDITSYANVERFAHEVEDTHSQVNLLINNAGVSYQKTFNNHSLEDWEKIIGINLWGVIYGCRAFEPLLRKAGKVEKAHVVNMSSMVAFMGMPNAGSYCATKAAIRSLSETLWAEWAPYNIGVTSVHPSAIKTNMIIATPENSDDVEFARKNFENATRFAKGPKSAVTKILKGVEKDKMRLRLGGETYLLDYLKRLMPTLCHRPLKGFVPPAQ